MRLVIQKLFPIFCTAVLLSACNEYEPAAKLASENTNNTVSSISVGSGQTSTNWLTVKDQEYGDSGVVVDLQATIKGEQPA